MHYAAFSAATQFFREVDRPSAPDLPCFLRRNDTETAPSEAGIRREHRPVTFYHRSIQVDIMGYQSQNDRLRDLVAARVEHRSIPVSLSSLEDSHPLSCVDGRKMEHVVGAPGGNAGLFLLLLTTLEQNRGVPIPNEWVTRLFERYLDFFGTFYMHSDRISVTRLAKTLRGNAAFESRGPIEAILRHPPADIQPELLRLLQEPRHTGCGHMAMMMSHPEQYGIRPALIDAFLTAFFQALWRGDERVIYDLLPGSHEELAIVTVQVENDGLQDTSLVPSICPSDGLHQFFVYHPGAASHMYHRHLLFIESPGDKRFELSPEVLLTAQHEVGRNHLQLTVSYLAPNLPFITVSPGLDRPSAPHIHKQIQQDHGRQYTAKTQPAR